MSFTKFVKRLNMTQLDSNCLISHLKSSNSVMTLLKCYSVRFIVESYSVHIDSINNYQTTSKLHNSMEHVVCLK